MSDDIWFALAVVVLLAAIAAGFRRWGGAVSPSARARFVLISTAIGGLIGAPFWWFDLPASFAWDLPPVASRMLAAAAFAFGLTGIAALEHPSEKRIRLYFTLIVVYLVPLGMAAVTLHLDRFDFSRSVTYGFFAVLIVLSLGSLLEIFATSNQSTLSEPPNRQAQVWLVLAGIVALVWGLALFAAPTTNFPLVFNWPQDPLSSRLIAAMLLTVAVAFLTSRGDAGLARLSLFFAGVYGVGVVAATLMNLAAGKPVPLLYTFGMGGLGVVSLAVLATVRSRPPSLQR